MATHVRRGSAARCGVGAIGLVLLTVFATGCRGDAGRSAAEHEGPPATAEAGPTPPGAGIEPGPGEASVPGAPTTESRPSPTPETPPSTASDEDWQIARQKLEWARSVRLDTLPFGDVVARVGESFLGTDYVPQTLEIPGPERLVVNLRQLDCVTFVENVLVLSRLVLEEPPGAEGDLWLPRRYQELLTEVRYRAGVISGYPSRLHYFSDWIADNEAKGLVRDVSRELGGVEDHEPTRFMSQHPDAYRQLTDPSTLEAIRDVEDRLATRPRVYIPEDRIDDEASEIRNGDIIAATSTVEGLDVAHTGIALWREGRLHLLHAPLVGESVQISERPLAQRILEFSGQDGIMVARPLDPRPGRSRTEH